MQDAFLLQVSVELAQNPLINPACMTYFSIAAHSIQVLHDVGVLGRLRHVVVAARLL